jgi:hypothetical protein
MRKNGFWVGMAYALIVLGFAGGAACAQQITVIMPGKVDIETPLYDFHARMLEMKEGFQLGVTYDRRTPFINLDMFFKMKIQVGAKALPQVAMPRITVKIPLEYITSVTKIKDADAIRKSLSFWDQGGKGWVSVDQMSKNEEVSAPMIQDGYLIFDILKWPIDDRLIGC